MNDECHMHADDYLDKTTNEVFGKRTMSQFKQILLSKICSYGVDVTDDESELHALKFPKKAVHWQPCWGFLLDKNTVL